MQIEEPLRQAQFVKRYKRFFADVILDGQTLVAHVPNTGSLKTCLFEGANCVISESQNPERKLKATLHFVHTPRGWAGVNTSLPNALVHEAWLTAQVPHWRHFGNAKREHKISKESRIDFLLTGDSGSHFVEVKNVTFAEDEVARFPDAVTERGQKHLRDLMRLKAEGHGAELVFVVQREGCLAFAPADEIDPEYGRLLREAHQKGVKILAYGCDIDPKAGVTLNPTPLRLEF